MPKYLLTFEKGESVRWLGHLDILRTFERAVRRAGLPIAFSNGFNPRERLAFASALSTGVTGESELLILELTDPHLPEALASDLNAALPAGIRIRQCQEIPDAGSRDLLNSFDRAEYEVVCSCPAQTQESEVDAAVRTLMAQPQISLTREREGRSKTVDIRPFLFHLAVRPDSVQKERCTVNMVVGLGESGNAKPAEVISALGDCLPGVKARRIHRIRLLKSRDTGEREWHQKCTAGTPAPILQQTP
jgi:radical SAM-linked protein